MALRGIQGPSAAGGQMAAVVAMAVMVAVAAVAQALPPAQLGARPEATRTAASVLAAYNHMASGRKFVLDAWQHPEQGGRFYAAKVVDFCAAMHQAMDPAILAKLEPARPGEPVLHHAQRWERREQALGALRGRCEGFVEGDRDRWGAQSADTATTPDVAFQAMRAVSNARRSGDTEAIRAATQRLVALKDPLTFDDLGARWMLSAGPGGGPAVYFDGQSYSLSTGNVAASALYLMPCLLGLRCDASSDPPLIAACIGGTACFEDRFQRAREELTGGDAAEYAQALQLAQAMAAAVQRGDSAAFLQR